MLSPGNHNKTRRQSVRQTLGGPFLKWLGMLDFKTIGFGTIGIFIITWISSVAFWKYKRYDELYN